MVSAALPRGKSLKIKCQGDSHNVDPSFIHVTGPQAVNLEKHLALLEDVPV